ncbi:MAG: hypothetical protein IJY22_04940, partial [Clostridia bacterium]|nr:hypothetical protein [Clostridia bacterium]
ARRDPYARVCSRALDDAESKARRIVPQAMSAAFLLTTEAPKKFRPLRRAPQGTALGIRQLLKKLDQNFSKALAA